MDALFLTYFILFGILWLILLISTVVRRRTYGKTETGTVTGIEIIRPWEKGEFGRRPWKRYVICTAFRADGTVWTVRDMPVIRKPKYSTGDKCTVFVNTDNPAKSLTARDGLRIFCNTMTVFSLLAFFIGLGMGRYLI